MIVDNAVERIEIDLLLEGIHRRWGYDFKHYSYASLKRRLQHARNEFGLTTYSDLLEILLHDPLTFDRFLRFMSITVTEMFRDPSFYLAVREKVIPKLKTFPYIKLWHAGCATGEEVYSMAIMLHEENFLTRARIYATDFNNHSLDLAEKGVFQEKHMNLYAANYHHTGGKSDFKSYYNGAYDLVKFKDFLKDRITFSYHNLVTDGVFGEMNFISCRNVLIYFDKELQERVLRLFTDSLRHGGFLCLGTKESLKFSAVKNCFEPVDAKQRIFRKCGGDHV